MIEDIGKMPATSRIWIYQASRPLLEKDKQTIEEKITGFLNQWETHGQPLKASWSLYYDRFLVMAVDDSFQSPSGCSIDESVHFLRELESELGIGFLEKSSVAVMQPGDSIEVFELKDVKKSVQQGKIQPDTIIFNNLVPTLGDLSTSWKAPASKSWLSRYFHI